MEEKSPKSIPLRVRAFLEKNGLYVVLFLCIGTLIGTAVLTSNPTERSLLEEPSPTYRQALMDIPPLPTLTADLSVLPDEPVAEDDSLAPVEATLDEELEMAQAEEEEIPLPSEQAPASEAPSTASGLSLVPPVNSTDMIPFAMENLQYSKTLDEWTTHSGVDYLGKEGDLVTAALTGVVKSAYTDPLMGHVVELAHDNGVETKYCGLQSLPPLATGETVKVGKSIGQMGNSGILEIEEGAHLHFEVLVDGEPVDPLAYMESLK